MLYVATNIDRTSCKFICIGKSSSNYSQRNIFISEYYPSFCDNGTNVFNYLLKSPMCSRCRRKKQYDFYYLVINAYFRDSFVKYFSVKVVIVWFCPRSCLKLLSRIRLRIQVYLKIELSNTTQLYYGKPKVCVYVHLNGLTLEIRFSDCYANVIFF